MAQKTITVGTPESKGSFDTNFGNAQDNFTELYSKLVSGSVALSEYGEITENTDISTIVNAAIDDIKLRFGSGIIHYPVGTYKAQGIKIVDGIYHVGMGEKSTILELPATPSAHIFTTPEGSTTINSGGVVGLELDGNSTTTYDGISLEGFSTAESFVVKNCYIHHLRNGYRGSLNDRRVLISENRIWNNVNGVYVRNNHPHFGTNDFRDNTYGITGESLYDIQVMNCRFAYNDYGIAPQPGGTLKASIITGNLFFKSNIVSLVIDSITLVSNNIFIPKGTDTGVEIRGDRNTCSGNHFRPEDVSYFGVSAIVLSTTTNSRSKINDNLFYVPGSTHIKGTYAGASSREGMSIDGNTFVGSKAAVDFSGETASFQYGSISNNKFSGTAILAMGTTPIFHIPVSVGGFVFMGNTGFAPAGSVTGGSLKADIRSSIVTGNRLRNLGAITIINSDGNTINTGNFVN